MSWTATTLESSDTQQALDLFGVDPSCYDYTGALQMYGRLRTINVASAPSPPLSNASLVCYGYATKKNSRASLDKTTLAKELYRLADDCCVG